MSYVQEVGIYSVEMGSLTIPQRNVYERRSNFRSVLLQDAVLKHTIFTIKDSSKPQGITGLAQVRAYIR